MRGALLGLLLFAGLQSVAAQQPAATMANTCTLEGTVLAADSGLPLRKTWVTLRKVQGRSGSEGAPTDASGHFLIKNIEPGRYRLEARRTGYVQQEYGQRGENSPGSILALIPGQHLRDLTFRMVRAAAISGHIYDEDGNPVEGARVSAMRYGYERGHRQLRAVSSAQTNDLGEYRLYGLRPGQYYVSASFNPYQYQFGQSLGGGTYAPAYYPGTADASEATPVSLRPGDDFPGVDVSLQATRTVSVSGKVFNAVTGQPGIGVNLFLQRRGGAVHMRYMLGLSSFVQDTQGTFKLEGVTPGSYYLIGEMSVEGKHYVSRVPVEVGDSDVTGINLVISPGIAIRGRLRGEGEVDLGGAKISLMPRGRENRFYFVETTPRKDGTFVFSNVSDGSYDVRLWPMPEDAYLKSVRLGDEEVLLKGVEITGGQSPGDLQVVVDGDGGRVSGTVVKDNNALNGAIVVLAPDDPDMRKERSWYKVIPTDQYGNFTLRGIRPGEYKIFAWEKIEPGAYMDPDFLERYKGEGRDLDVREGSQQAVRLAVAEEKDSR